MILSAFNYNRTKCLFNYEFTCHANYIKTRLYCDLIPKQPTFGDFINKDIRYQKPKIQIKYLFDNFGNRLLPEPHNITYTKHALQTATLAMNNTDKFNKHLIVAALLHNIHNVMPGNSQSVRENLNDPYTGYNFLKYLNLPDNIIEPIRLHLDADKYLCATSKDYYNKLYDSSKFSLGYVCDDSQCEKFLSNKYAENAIKIRLWSDLSKEKNIITKDIDFFFSLFTDDFLFSNGWIKTNNRAYKSNNLKKQSTEQYLF